MVLALEFSFVLLVDTLYAVYSVQCTCDLKFFLSTSASSFLFKVMALH